ISAGTVKIHGIAREAGFRTKMAVESLEEGVDPVGSCVGQRGTRVQTVLNEIGGDEKIDIVLWDEDPKKFIANALSPAKVKEIKLNEKKKHAEVLVDPDQLSLAIGKEGRNVRLASKLTGYEIDVYALQDGKKVKGEEVKAGKNEAEKAEKEEDKKTEKKEEKTEEGDKEKEVKEKPA
ncbi:transcription termination/antitermination protein NusA, partial [bacterium]|nr:transcription termination/antitermination protein NusA [bacterium]